MEAAMARLSETERRAFRDVQGALERWSPGAPRVLETVLPAIGELLGAEKPVAYAVRPRGSGVACSFLEGPLPNDAREHFDAFLARQPVGWGGYDPLCPQAEQRNRPQANTATEMAAVALADVFRRFDLHGRAQLRVLVCDGPSLLAWVGGFRPDAFTAHEARVLAALTPALQRALLIEKRFESAALGAAALDACLEYVASAAFVVSRRGFIEHANQAGWDALGRRGIEVVRAVAEAVAGARPGWETVRLSPDEPCDHLVIAPAPADDVHAVARRAARRWSLTPRQTEVLALVGQGFTNLRIAGELGCSPRTVEIHISNILRRADCGSRASLTAKMWREARR